MKRKYFGFGGVPTAPCATCGTDLTVINHATGETDICMTCEERSPSHLSKNLCVFCDNKIKPS